jgi:glycosyltransferase involved in cell wall biosynthesis
MNEEGRALSGVEREFFDELFKRLGRAGVVGILLRNHEDFPMRIGHDLDVFFPRSDLHRAIRIFRETLHERDGEVLHVHDRDYVCAVWFRAARGEPQAIHMDFYHGAFTWHGLPYVSESELIAASRPFGLLKIATKLMPTIGLHAANFPVPPRTVRRGPLQLLFVGNLLPLKGLDFGLKALKASGTEARLTLIGEGAFKKNLETLAANLGLKDGVEFRGRLPRAQALAAYKDFDVCLFPSLHDSGGYAVIEAMCNAMPTICLAVGEPDTAVRAGGGISVPLGSRAEVVAGLARAIRSYDSDRESLLKDGLAGRKNVEENYDWEHKGKRMNDFYREALR